MSDMHGSRLFSLSDFYAFSMIMFAVYTLRVYWCIPILGGFAFATTTCFMCTKMRIFHPSRASQSIWRAPICRMCVSCLCATVPNTRHCIFIRSAKSHSKYVLYLAHSRFALSWFTKLQCVFEQTRDICDRSKFIMVVRVCVCVRVFDFTIFLLSPTSSLRCT